MVIFSTSKHDGKEQKMKSKQYTKMVEEINNSDINLYGWGVQELEIFCWVEGE